MGLLGTFLGRLFGKQPAMKLAPGDPAPAFDVLDHEGRRVRSEDLAGKRYVLWFYPKAATPG